MSLLLGCIADDLTGATDLANMLVRGGMRVVQMVGIPKYKCAADDVDAIVVSLKTRNIDPNEAVRQSLAALFWLQELGTRRFFFKYCSTFDSTDRGNIGPVTTALRKAIGTDITVACPSFPANGRTVYQGHLFVGDRLLSESGMENHPITPMNDSDLVRVLGRQTADRVGLVSIETVNDGADAIRKQMRGFQAKDVRIAIVDAICEENLAAAASAFSDLPLMTGGSGIAQILPQVYRQQGLLDSHSFVPTLPNLEGIESVIAGSCSLQTLRQVERFKAHRPSFELDADRLVGGDAVQEASDWAKSRLDDGPFLIYSSAPPDSVAALQERLGRQAAGQLVEDTLANIAVRLVELGVRRLVIAGGETSGAILNLLGVNALRIGPQIDPGVPWTESTGEPQLALALKSGNFGGDDFFLRALEMLR